MLSSTAYINGIAVATPSGRLTNDELLAAHPDWDMNWVAKRVGLTSRAVAPSHVTASDLAAAAAEHLLTAMSVDRAGVDALIFCTQTPDYGMPASACVLQHRLGLSTATAAFDVNQGCSGYVYGLALARALVLSGTSRRVLLLAADTLSRTVDPSDKSVRVLFGDAGSATLVSADPGAALGAPVLGTDGSGAQAIQMGGGFRDDGSHAPRRLTMDGQAVQTFATTHVPALVQRVLEQNGLQAADVSKVVLHQANAFMLERMCPRMGLTRDQMPIHFDGYGNTSSCTIPVVLTDLGRDFPTEKPIVLAGFGVGFSWGGIMVDWARIPLFGAEQVGATFEAAGAAHVG